MITVATHGNLEILSDGFLLDKKPEIRRFAESDGIRELSETVGTKTLLVLGGDGTMLRAIRQRHSENVPFLGANFGTKGFLLNRPEDLAGAERFVRIPYPLLEISTKTASGNVSEGIAFNEAQIKTAGGHMVTLGVSVGGHSEITLKGDGLLVVTPAGTTGYNASAGGPILPHSSPLFVATPLVPFEPKRAAPVVFEDADEVVVRHEAGRGQTLSVYADSTAVITASSEPVEILIRKFRNSVTLLIPERAVPHWKRRIFEEQGFLPPKRS